MVAVPASPPVRPPALAEASRNSTTTWQEDLQALFHHAKDRFPDVVWELMDEEAMDAEAEEVWGHKAIVYARAPPSFQARYFSFRPPPIASPSPYSTSPTPTLPAQSALSLSLNVDYPVSLRSGSPFRATSPAPSSIVGGIMRIPTTNNPTMFQNELEYLYTGKGFGEAFEFLFDTTEQREEGDAEENRIHKLRKDLVFMWRSRLYSDVRIELTSNAPAPITPDGGEESTAAFSTHRFILISRSPYFFDQLVTYGSKALSGDQPTIKLPSPPFTPPSLHFILGFLYTGTLNFSNRTYDLDTAFHIMRCATYLQLQSLYDETQARIVQEMMHGLFHAFLEFSEYERITGGKWGTGGCRCRQCSRRAPRVLEYSLQPDVRNTYLERGVRRALVGLFGEGWCTPEFATLPSKTKDGLLKGLAKRTTPLNVFPLLFACHAAMTKLNGIIENWADETREMVLGARKTIDDTICNQAEACFEQTEWVELMEADGGRFEDGERVEWVMDALRRGLSEKNAGTLYQTLVSSILLRPHPTEPGETLISSTSHIRVQVEQMRMDILRWLRRRWMGVRQEGGFDALEGWSIKEISHEIDVPVDDLVSAIPRAPQRGTHGRQSQRQATSRADDAESIGMHSLRTSVLSRNANRPVGGENITSSAASTRSVARSTMSTTSRATASTAAPSVRVTRPSKASRPDSKLTPSPSVATSSSSQSTYSMDVDTPENPVLTQAASSAASKRPAFTARGPRTPAAVTSPNNAHETPSRPKSSAASVTSVRSHASTIRKTSPNSQKAGRASTLRPGSSRPSSAVSTRSEASTTFKTAPESMERRVSTASTLSTTSTRSLKSPKPRIPPLPTVTRSRRGSSTSVASAASSVATRRTKVPSTPATGAGKSTLSAGHALKRTTSSTSVKSNASSSSKRVIVKRPSADNNRKSTGSTGDSSAAKSGASKKPTRPLPEEPKEKENIKPEEPSNAAATLSVKGKERSDIITADNRLSTATAKKSDGGSSSRGAKRKGSNETITLSSVPTVKQASEPSTVTPTAHPQPRGATLDIGIPCIISSKRKRFRAFARYIGEVEGERGPWVGIEVPVTEQWLGEQNDDRQWNDGTWGGIRYFEIGATSEWGDDDYYTPSYARRRRMDWVNGQKGSKREGDQLNVGRKKRLRSTSPAVSDNSTAEYRGLFVRPQQVLYVVDAVGSDL